ncbi:MAG: hypothetical protein MUF75_09775 [Bacteroidia bacterium]|jgi:hypothetical protein|nr:hypothetical protein [Bacteroidia bacterium]
MTLGELIKTNNWLSVEQTYCSLFPDQIEAIDAYRELYHNLLLTAPFASDITIVLEKFSEDPDTSYIDISGRTKAPTQDITESLALEFVSWKEWLGMTIEGKTIQSFSQLEIICHCLNEMTFFWF